MVWKWVGVCVGFHVTLGVGLLAVEATHGINDRDASFALALLFSLLNRPTFWALRVFGVAPSVVAVLCAGILQWAVIGVAVGGLFRAIAGRDDKTAL